MHTLVLEIPGELSASLRVPPEEQLARLRRELAARLYQKEILTFGKARELARLTKWEFSLFLGEEGILRRYDEEDLKQDMQTLEALA
ncbi:MAG: UPF0175 family protein [Chloroflexi bacterium]|nr:UPF0175 family protein [Chloroflexota bacterium]